MNKHTIIRIASLFAFLLSSTQMMAQVTLSPSWPTASQSITITYDAKQGNAALVGASKVYIHTGVILDSPTGTTWSNTIGNWGQDDGVGQMTSLGNDVWQFTLTPDSYYGVDPSVNIFRLVMVFRNPAGDIVGKDASGNDIFMDIDPGFYVLFDNPASGSLFEQANTNFTISASTPSSASIDLYIDNVLVQSTTGTSLSYATSFSSAGSHTARVDANDGSTLKEKTATINIYDSSPVAARPAGVIDGVNYINDSTVVFSLLAPGKSYAHVVGDFNSWQVDPAYQMKKTPDGEHFWLEVSGLTSGQEYIFQYIVDGNIRIADPYTDQVADPWNDSSIPSETYPGLISWTNTSYGIASVLQTAQQQYQWQTTNFSGPARNELVVYELLLRDFTAQHSYQSVIDSIQYLKDLGINAIELLPVNEFEGNDSWGYNPSFYFAPDKYYGPKNKLKELVDVAHQNGIAVVMDLVLNHAFGQNVMARLYWDDVNNQLAADNPWFNQTSPNTCYYWGEDFNHESPYTQNFVDSVNSYWLTEYHVDGFRYDFTKGFTNVNDGNCGWNYDQSRINILERMANHIWSVKSDAYVILEHLTDPSEESVLSGYGMLPWKRVDEAYKNVISGWQLDTQHFGSAQDGGHMVYMESHDEERIMYQNLTYGNQEGSYNIQDLPTALDRVAMGAAFLYTVPGPKMIWMFGEQGYDYSIDYGGRVSAKPLVWQQYMQDPNRVDLKNTFAALLNLRNSHPVFNQGYFTWNDIGSARWINITHQDMNVVIVGNFDTHNITFTPTFPHTGTWYDYFTGSEVQYNGGTMTLGAGEWMLLTDVQLPLPAGFEVPQIVDVTPQGFTADDNITITFDATQATGNLVGATKVYMHSGVVLDSATGTTWSNVVGNWGADDGVGQMTSIGNDKWQISLTPRSYYSVAAGQPIYRLAMVFRDATGTNTGKGPGGSDIFVDVTQAAPQLVAPSNLTATASGSQVDLSWSDNTTIETGYVVERSYTSGTGYTVIATLAADVTTYSDTGLADSTYYYRVKATGSGGTETAYSNEASATVNTTSGLTVYFYKPSSWTTANVHYWNYTPAGALPQSVWPGPSMTLAPEEGANWYKYTFTGVTSTNLLFNDNGASQTADLTRNSDGWYKDGVWYDTKPAAPTGLTIHFYKPTSWSTANMHYWSVTPINSGNNIPDTSWPGVSMNDDGTGWWSYTIVGASCANIVFNDNGSSQTGDLSRCGEGWYNNAWSSTAARVADKLSASSQQFTFNLGQNYPNPANDFTIIDITLPQSQSINLSIYNIQGKVIKTIHGGSLNKGAHQFILNTNELESGIYFYRLQSDNQTLTKRMIIR